MEMLVSLSAEEQRTARQLLALEPMQRAWQTPVAAA